MVEPISRHHLGAMLLAREVGGQRHHRRRDGAGALQRAPGDRPARCRRPGGDEAAGGEQHQADDDHGLPAPAVGAPCRRESAASPGSGRRRRARGPPACGRRRRRASRRSTANTGRMRNRPSMRSPKMPASPKVARRSPAVIRTRGGRVAGAADTESRSCGMDEERRSGWRGAGGIETCRTRATGLALLNGSILAGCPTAPHAADGLGLPPQPAAEGGSRLPFPVPASSRNHGIHPHPRRPHAQPQEHQPRPAAQPADRRSPGCPVRARPRSPSTRSTPRASAATSSRCRPTRGSSCS